MNNQDLFDIVGLATAGLALPFQYWITYLFLGKLLGFKYRTGVFILIVAVLTAIKGYIFILKIPLPVYMQLVIDNLLLLIIIYFLCKGSFWAKLYAFITQAAVIMLTAIAFISVDYKVLFILLNKLNMDNASDVVLLFMIDVTRDFINLLICYIFLKSITNRVNFRENTLKWYQGIYLLVPNFAIHGLAVLFYVVQEIKINDTDYYLFTIFPNMYYAVPIISAALLVSLLFTAFTFRKMLEGEEIEQNHLLMQQQFKQQVNHSKSVEELYNGIRGVRHDMNHHLICLQHLAEENNIEEIKKYLSNMENSITRLNPGIKTGNSISDAVINEKYNLAQTSGIMFEQDFLLPDELIEPMDLCIILSNALDNAIEACMRIEDYSIPKTICIKSRLKDMYLLIEISNSTVNQLQYADNQIVSKKKDNINHGIGISNIVAAVKKYDGVVDILEGENKFTMNLMLKVR